MKHLLSTLFTVGILFSLCACSISFSNINIPSLDNEITTPDITPPPVADPDESNQPDTPTINNSTPPSTDEIVPPEQDTSDHNDEQESTEQIPPEDETSDDVEEEYIRTIDPYAPMVALTFDDGPHELYSQQILDVLEQHHAVATFFEVGYNARRYPDILRRMAELGCEIASHSNSHYDLTTLSRDAMLTDLAKLDQIIYDATGIMPTLVRPPYGAVNSMVKYESGRAMILWTVDTKDWLYRDTQVLIDYFMNYGNLDGEIVLMHSIHATTAEAMAVVVPWLIEQGYQLVTVSELMAYYYGELLEANHYYNQTYFARRDRTEYPIELPAEPMQTEIPAYTVVPVVPMPDPEDPPSDTDTPEQPPQDGQGGETPPPEGEPENETPPADENDDPVLPNDDSSVPTDEPETDEETTSGNETPPSTESEEPGNTDEESPPTNEAEEPANTDEDTSTDNEEPNTP